jgi:NDP-sugar pyrophosphorylase family protein
MVEIGGRPILWHTMMYYSHYGFNNFALALGYKGEVIKKYMVDYCSLKSLKAECGFHALQVWHTVGRRSTSKP